MILAFDSSTSQGSVAILREGKTVRDLLAPAPRGRGSALFTALEEILSDSPPLSRVVVGIGPGSYNGIRSALAAGWGIAAVRGIPLIGVSSLLGLDDGEFIAVGDARRGQFYFARVSSGEFIEEPHLLDKTQILEKLENCGDQPPFVPSPIEFLPEAIVRTPSAVRLGLLGASREPGVGVPEPMYLKPAYINLPGYR